MSCLGRRILPHAAVGVVLLLVTACGDTGADGSGSKREEAQLEPAGQSAGASFDLLDTLPESPADEEPTAVDRAATGVSGTTPALDAAAPPPEGGCRELIPDPVKIWPAEALTAVTAAGEDWVVAGITPTAERSELFLVRISSRGLPTPLHHEALGPRKEASPPAVAAVSPARVIVGFVDGETRVRIAETDARPGSRKLAWLEIGKGADPRFPPAIAVQARSRTIAYTDGSLATSMRVVTRVISADGRLGDVEPVGLPGMGGAAPVFLSREGHNPRLAFIDPRAGPSPIVAVELDGSGRPLEPEVLLIAGSVFEPPEIAVSSVDDALWVGYTAIGRFATSAVGLRRAGDSGAPRALVAGKGNGRLHVGATSGGKGTVFVADAMSHDVRDGAREVHVRVVRGDTLGEALVIGTRPVPGPGEAGASPSDRRGRDAAVARTQSGLVAVSFRSAGGTFATFLRCDDH